MNMFKPVKAKNAKAYFDALPEERKKDMKALDKLIRKSVPKLKPNFMYNMPGYGAFEYKSYKKEIGEWPIIAIASQKNYMSIYVCAIDKGGYIAEKYKKTLGKVDVGRSCIRFKKLEDLNLKTLEKVIRLAAKSPGLVEASKHKKNK